MNEDGQLRESLQAIRRQYRDTPQVAMILGTGLGELADQVDVRAAIDYRDIPHFPTSTALSHKGRLVCGQLAQVPVVAMQGRCHLYEGYTGQQVGWPVKVMRALGAHVLVVSNAAGGVNPRYRTGDVVVMTDHINFMGPRSLPTGGWQQDAVAPQRSSSVYDGSFIEQALAVGRREDFAAHRGVYVSVTGPSYETRSEYRMFRQWGGDVVGMSTVPEVLTAARCGFRVLALSMVTNVARPDVYEKVDAEDVVAVAQQCQLKMQAIVVDLLRSL